MQNKLQELTDKLYNEGLSKGKQEGEEMLKKAHAEADNIVAQAKADAERIIAQANREAEELKTKVAADVKMAAVQSIAATRQELEQMVVTKVAHEGVNANLTSADFVKEILQDVVKAFNPQNATPVDLDIVLPESLKAKMEPFVGNEIGKLFGTSVNVRYSKKMNGGFNVAPKDGGYMLQFTDEAFQNIISSYLRPATKKILFG